MSELSAEQQILLEQYKVYVRDSWGVADRRASNHRFFMVIHAGLLFGLFDILTCAPNYSAFALLCLIVIAGFAINIVWLTGLTNFNALSKTKWNIVRGMEDALRNSIASSPVPDHIVSGPYNEEGIQLHNVKNQGQPVLEGFSKDIIQPIKYRPMTMLERWVPIILSCFYIVLAVGYTILILNLDASGQDIKAIFLEK